MLKIVSTTTGTWNVCARSHPPAFIGDTLRVLEEDLHLDAADKAKIFEGNARRLLRIES